MFNQSPAADHCLSIDFGNAFTKVAFRPGCEAPSEFLTSPDLQFDRGLNLCIPTLAVKVGVGEEARWFFGADARDIPYNRPGATFYADWKHDFFRSAEEPGSSGVLGPASFVEHSDSVGHPTLEEEDLDLIAHGFFEWLAGFAGERLAQRGLPPLREIETRVAIPSFAIDSDAESRLLNVLGEAGFRVAYAQPTLPEPLANALGVFSSGRNRLTAELAPDYRGMFDGTRMMEALKARARTRTGPLAFWTLVVDLGAYTLDVAVMGFSTCDPARSLMNTYYGKERFGLYSEPLGASDLNQRIRSVLEPANRGTFDAIVRGADAATQHLFYDNLLQWRRPFYARGANGPIGAGDEGARIHDQIDGFAREVGLKLRQFLKRFKYHRVDEVVLTGGGMNIPAVREAAFRVAERAGATHAFIPAQEGQPPVPHAFSPMSQLQVRGATALGGASVFFERAPEILNR